MKTSAAASVFYPHLLTRQEIPSELLLSEVYELKETKNLLLVDDTEVERELTRRIAAAQHKKDMRSGMRRHGF